MLLLLFTLFQPLPADTLKQDQWLAWITPTSLFHAYHPALEAGLEFTAKQRTAYSLSYGIDLGSSGSEPYNNQHTKYLRLATKFYKTTKPTSPFLMPELSLFQIGHEGKYITADAPLSPFPRKAEATFKDWVVKAGGLLGQKATWGVLRVEVFLGGGIRFGSSQYRIQNVGGEHVEGPDKHNWAKLNTDVRLTKNIGKMKVPTSPYISLGLRVGFPLKTHRTP